jgi:hypothetical protein
MVLQALTRSAGNTFTNSCRPAGSSQCSQLYTQVPRRREAISVQAVALCAGTSCSSYSTP